MGVLAHHSSNCGQIEAIFIRPPTRRTEPQVGDSVRTWVPQREYQAYRLLIEEYLTVSGIGVLHLVPLESKGVPLIWLKHGVRANTTAFGDIQNIHRRFAPLIVDRLKPAIVQRDAGALESLVQANRGFDEPSAAGREIPDRSISLTENRFIRRAT